MLQASFLAVRREFDAADQLRRGLEPDADFGGEGLVERILDRRALLRWQFERAAHERRLGRRFESARRAVLSPGRSSLASDE